MRIVINDALSVLRARLEHREPANMMIRGVINDSILANQLTFWVWDGANGNEARRSIYPRYKSNRQPASSDIFRSLQFLRGLIKHTPAWQAQLDGFEGDDVIAALVETYRGSGLPIEIRSTDGDLNALCGPNVTCTARISHTTVPNHLVRLFKLTWGDKSDTIAGIKGFGDKSWAEADKALLQTFVDGLLDGQPLCTDTADQLKLTTITKNWLSDPQNIEELRAMAKIIAPLPITPEQLSSCLTKGVDNPAARDAALRSFLL